MPQYFALVNSDNVVEEVIEADQAFVDSNGVEGKTWVETSMDGTVGGKYAGIGDTYNANIKGFVELAPHADWSLNEKTATWEAPIPMPKDGNWMWDEKSKNWVVWDKEALPVPVEVVSPDPAILPVPEPVALPNLNGGIADA